MAEANEDQLYGMCEQMSTIAEKMGAVDVLMAETSAEQGVILKIRSEVGNAVKPKVCDALDVTVPPAAIPDMLDAIDKVGEKYGIFIPVVGHAGDGNLHPNMMWEYDKKGILKDAKKDIYAAAIALGGVISGEHGIGKTRLPQLEMNIDPKSRELMCGIKKLFTRTASSARTTPSVACASVQLERHTKRGRHHAPPLSLSAEWLPGHAFHSGDLPQRVDEMLVHLQRHIGRHKVVERWEVPA